MQDLNSEIKEFESMSEEERKDETARLFHELMGKLMDKVFMERKSYILMDDVNEEEVDKYIVKLAEEKKAKYENYTKGDMAKAMLMEALSTILDSKFGDDKDETELS